MVKGPCQVTPPSEEYSNSSAIGSAAGVPLSGRPVVPFEMFSYRRYSVFPCDAKTGFAKFAPFATSDAAPHVVPLSVELTIAIAAVVRSTHWTTGGVEENAGRMSWAVVAFVVMNAPQRSVPVTVNVGSGCWT